MDSTSAITLLGLAASSFIATNMDNLLLLVILQGAYPRRRGVVLLGYMGAVLVLLGVSTLGAVAGKLLDTGVVGYLGLVPILLGGRMLYLAWKDRRHPEEGLDAPANRSLWGILLGTLGLMLGNSGDSLAVMIPLLAETDRSGQWTVLIGYLVCAILWAGVAWKLAGQRALVQRLERRGEKIVPWIMVGVGCYILLNTATDTLA